MMKSIWKYTLEVDDEQEILIPIGAQFLDVQVQHGEPQMWCLVDVDALKMVRKIIIIGTGHPIEEEFNGVFIATFQIRVGQEDQVYHVFDMGVANQKQIK